MEIVPPGAQREALWANGGGTTREIARHEAEGRLLWRLSLARVARDGPFSAFPGMRRILTVVEGAGVALTAPGLDMVALPGRPLGFPGAPGPAARLVAGPVAALNLIFDAARLKADAEAVAGPCRVEGPGLLWLWPDGAAAPPLPPGGTALLAAGEAVDLPAEARGVLIRLRVMP
jgi:environmental stress-induced protein Ves